jgi:hypothetical protein
MQLNSQLMQVDLRQIRIAHEAKDAFTLSSSFSYQMNASLLNSRIRAHQPWDFEIPFAYKYENGLIHVFAGWLALQSSFQTLLPQSKLICVRLYDNKPKGMETIAWQYVMHTLSRSQHRNFTLAYVAKTVELCPSPILQKILKTSLSSSTLPCTMQLCSEARQPVRSQIKKLALNKVAQND